MILWANVTALLAPVDLKEAAAADLTHVLMGSLVHTCRETSHMAKYFFVFLFVASGCAAINLRDYLVDKACSLWKRFEALRFHRDTPGTQCKRWSCLKHRVQFHQAKSTNILYIT